MAPMYGLPMWVTSSGLSNPHRRGRIYFWPGFMSEMRARCVESNRSVSCDDALARVRVS